MIAICPAGPPKLIKPSLTQYLKASQNPTGLVPASCRLPTLHIISTYLVNNPEQPNQGYIGNQDGLRKLILGFPTVESLCVYRLEADCLVEASGALVIVDCGNEGAVGSQLPQPQQAFQQYGFAESLAPVDMTRVPTGSKRPLRLTGSNQQTQ